jgi:hypothetical protein
MSDQNIARYVSADTGPSYWGPGDRYIFLVTGAQSDGAYFIGEPNTADRADNRRLCGGKVQDRRT